MAAERALEVLRDALDAWFSDREDEPAAPHGSGIVAL
jgi:hypothetical protein